MFDLFPSLKHLTVYCNCKAGISFAFDPIPASHPIPITAINGKVYPELRSLALVEWWFALEGAFLEAFPDLAKLTIDSGEGTDDTIQLIIQNLTGLQTLVLNPCQPITDFGVTGINNHRCKALLDSRFFYLKEKECTRLENDVVGFPLSSLKCEGFLRRNIN
jgi:hypothetical protein